MEKSKNPNAYLLKILASIIGGVIFWYLLKYIVWWVPNLAEVLDYAKKPLKESHLIKLLGLILAIVVSFVLLKLKNKFLLVFGMLEIVGGVFTIWTTFSNNFENNTLYALAIGGGIFLLIKGLENATKESKKQSNYNDAEQ